MQLSRDELVELLEPAVQALGYELADLEAHLGGPNGVLRLFIDGDAGITLEDCELVSRQISSVLDVADRIGGNYRLEAGGSTSKRCVKNTTALPTPFRARPGARRKTGYSRRRRYCLHNLLALRN